MKAMYVKEIDVIDPDTNGVVTIAIYKHENGGMFGIDSSYILAIDGDADEPMYVPDVFCLKSDFENVPDEFFVELIE